NDYGGAVILISHDRHLLEATVDRLWIVRDGTVSPYDGDLDTYRQGCLRGSGGRPSDNGAARSAPVRDSGQDVRRSREDERRAAAQRRLELAPLKKKLGEHERRMELLQQRIGQIDLLLAEPSLYEREPEKAQALSRQRGELAKALS